MNTTIEKDLCRYGRDDVVTSDYYKDNQRKTVYELLDQVQMFTSISASVVNKTKLMFHTFCTKMYRIHTPFIRKYSAYPQIPMSGNKVRTPRTYVLFWLKYH